MYAKHNIRCLPSRNNSTLRKQIALPILSAAFLSFLLLPVALSPAFSASIQQIELAPEDDVYVANDLNDPTDRVGLKNLNTGEFEFMKVWYAWNVTKSGKEKIISLGYMKYDLSGIAAQFVESAKLQMYSSVLNLTGAARAVDLHLAFNDDWDEQTLTYGTAPTFTPEANSTTIVSKPGKYYSWDVTELVKEKAGSELPLVITFRTLYQNSEEQVVFNTKEAADESKAPKLLIEYSGPIIPATETPEEAISVIQVAEGSDGADDTSMIIYGSLGGAAAAGGFAFFMYNKQRNGHSSTIIARKDASTSEVRGAVEGEASFCFNCGKAIKPEYNACPYCGTNLKTNPQ